MPLISKNKTKRQIDTVASNNAMVADRKMAYWHWLRDIHAPILDMLLKSVLFDLPLSLIISLAALLS